MAYSRTTQCTWEKFYTHALHYLNSLHEEPCPPQMKIAKFIIAARHRFANPALTTKKSKKSTRMSQDLHNSTTDKSDSAYNEPTTSETESECTKITSFQDHTTHIQRPSTKNRRRPPTPHPHIQETFSTETESNLDI